MEEIREFKSVEDLVRTEQDFIIKGIRQTLSKESIQIINREIELNPVIFRSKYPELFDYIITLKD